MRQGRLALQQIAHLSLLFHSWVIIPTLFLRTSVISILSGRDNEEKVI